MRSASLSSFPISKIRVGDKLKVNDLSWGYIQKIRKDDGTEGNHILHQGYRITLGWMSGTTFNTPLNLIDKDDIILYPTLGVTASLENGSYYYVRRKLIDPEMGEFLTIGQLSYVDNFNHTARIAFAGDPDDCCVTNDGSENYFSIPLSSILRKINYMG